jgi:RNA polymerase sigma-70 factor (ECF subfamily)
MADSIPESGAPRAALDSDLTDLVAQAQKNPALFAPIYDRYIRPVYRYLYSCGLSTPEADDLAAQTFLSVLEALPRYRHKGYFSAWLFSIARNKVMDLFRKNKHEIAFGITSEGAEHPDLLGNLIQQQDIQRLVGLIRALDGDGQELIRLRYAAELSFSEMAVLLGKNEEAVKKALYRLVAHLQRQMEVERE